MRFPAWRQRRVVLHRQIWLCQADKKIDRRRDKHISNSRGTSESQRHFWCRSTRATRNIQHDCHLVWSFPMPAVENDVFEPTRLATVHTTSQHACTWLEKIYDHFTRRYSDGTHVAQYSSFWTHKSHCSSVYRVASWVKDHSEKWSWCIHCSTEKMTHQWR